MEAARRTAAMAVCTAIPVPQGCSGRCRDRRDRPQRLRRKRSGRNCQFRHGLTATQKGKSAQIAHAIGGSRTGLQHRRGLLLPAQGGETCRRYRPGRRQQLDHPVSGSRGGPDTDQSSSALLHAGPRAQRPGADRVEEGRSRLPRPRTVGRCTMSASPRSYSWIWLQTQAAG